MKMSANVALMIQDGYVTICKMFINVLTLQSVHELGDACVNDNFNTCTG